MLRRSLLAAALTVALAFDAAAAVPDVVVSIKPLHSLVASLMDGVGEPTLLVGGGASLHSFSLKPSAGRGAARRPSWWSGSAPTWRPSCTIRWSRWPARPR